jgi:ribosome-binding protein aMBF1 (putative translation factor)
MGWVMPIGISQVNEFLEYQGAVRKDHLASAISSRVVQLVREERERQGMSMNMLAQRSGLAQSSISRIEHELRVPNLETLLRICMVLEADLGRIIKRATQEAGQRSNAARREAR